VVGIQLGVLGTSTGLNWHLVEGGMNPSTSALLASLVGRAVGVIGLALSNTAYKHGAANIMQNIDERLSFFPTYEHAKSAVKSGISYTKNLADTIQQYIPKKNPLPLRQA
ncbi:hypothetical protein JXB11_02555, partial [Candidatus Woesearchaeota archaeon]|nr:hypothetical protein [Candidatus Woesearchaeota archaeon]